MSESRESEDPFFSSIRALKAMIQPKSTTSGTGTTHRLLHCSNEGAAVVTVGAHHVTPHTKPITTTTTTTPIQESTSILAMRNVLVDLQSKLREVEEVAAQEMVLRIAVERERDEIQARWNANKEHILDRRHLEDELNQLQSALQETKESAAKERSKLHQRFEQERLELVSSLKAAEESVSKEQSLRTATEQLLQRMQLERETEHKKFMTEAQIRSHLEQEIQDLRNKLNAAEVTIDDLQGEKVALKQQLLDTKISLEEMENNMSHEKLLRRAVEQDMYDLQAQLKSDGETVDKEKRTLQLLLSNTQKALSEERALRLRMEHKRDELHLENDQVTNELEKNPMLRQDSSPAITTPVRNADQHSLVHDLSTRLRAAEATAEKERQQRLTVEQERDEVLLECGEARTLFHSPMEADPFLLKKEAQRLLATKIEERKKHLKEMDRIHLQLQQAISQRDSMEARLHGAKKVTDNLSQELDKAYAKIRELTREDDNGSIMHNSMLGKHGRSDNSGDPISVEENKTVTNTRVNEDKNLCHENKHSKLSDY